MKINNQVNNVCNIRLFCRHITKLTSTGDLKQVIQGVLISTLALSYYLHPQISYLFVLSTINNGCIMTIFSVQWHTVVWYMITFICVYCLFFCNYYQT